ncbi:MAG: RES family NAD+ phosphorylase [Candidatus Limnocylindrales bacterium]
MPRRPTGTPRTIEWPAGRTLWRVSKDATATRFSTGTGRLFRFSPIVLSDGTVVPTWYGATSQAGAIFESIFHDVRPPHRDRRIAPNEYIDRILAPVVTARSLTLVDLTTDGLHSIGISRAALIESTSQRYRWTIEQAVLLRKAAPTADGFVWVSRARDTALSVVLYGNREDRGDPEMLMPGEGPALPLGIGAGLELLRTLAEAARITIVLPDRAS